MTISTFYDNLLLTGPTFTLTIPSSGTRTQSILDLQPDSPSMHRNIGCAFQFTGSEMAALYEWQPSYLVEPEDTIDRPTDWMDAGTLHYKFIHGCRIQANTNGIARTVQIQYDGGINGPVLTVSHMGELILPYSFPPFKARLLRLVPTDANAWQLFQVEWEFDIEPDPTSYWVTQPTSFGLSGFGHMRDFQIAYATVNAGSTLLMLVDGVSYTLAASLPSTNGNEIKAYFPSPPLKGKLWQLYGTGTALQIYANDCEFRVKQWGGDTYQVLKPIGDQSVTSGGARL